MLLEVISYTIIGTFVVSFVAVAVACINDPQHHQTTSQLGFFAKQNHPQHQCRHYHEQHGGHNC
jgi:hypothetical protein